MRNEIAFTSFYSSSGRGSREIDGHWYAINTLRLYPPRAPPTASLAKPITKYNTITFFSTIIVFFTTLSSATWRSYVTVV